MRVVIVHDYLTQRGGAERVVLELLRAYPHARVVTSVHQAETTFPDFAEHRVDTLWLDDVAAFRRDPRRAFPFLASAFERHVVRDADLVIASSSGWAHRVRTTGAPKVVYCHNPARWLYQPDDYLQRVPPSLQWVFTAATRRLRRTDRVAARTASAYLVNSSSVARRVRDVYGIEPVVVAPARGVSPTAPQRPVPGIAPDFLLTVGRARGYKHTDTIREAVRRLPGERLVVVGAEPAEDDHDRVTVLPRVDDAQLRWLYANAAALVAMSYEDFGLTPVEAQGFGTPSLVLRGGGYLDSTEEGVTGLFVDQPTPHAVAEGIRELRSRPWPSAPILSHGERYSPESFGRRLHDVVDRVLIEPTPLAR